MKLTDNNKDLKLRREFFNALHKQYAEGKITNEEFTSFVIAELDNIEKDRSDLEIKIPDFFNRRKS